jgi:glycosyltransferase involved in cell wall biosynthesis
MKVGLYTPYFYTLGGGEKYLLTIAEVLSDDHHVEIILPESTEIDIEKDRAMKRFADLKLDKIKFRLGPFSDNAPWWKRSLLTAEYDLFFYVTDGSFFWSKARKNVVIIQSPDTLNLGGWKQRFKQIPWKIKLCYSEYVRQWLEKKWHLDLQVLPPAIDPSSYKVAPKQNIILMVGRFSQRPHDKKHTPMVHAFREMIDKHLLDGWRLVIMGGLRKDQPEDVAYYQEVVNVAKGYPIDVVADASFEELINTYSQAKIFWHATGFKEDLQKVPEKAEHFGITTVEAMASSVVPIVVNAGGQPEIVQHEVNGLLWSNTTQLQEFTLALAHNEHKREIMAIAARKRAFDFDKKTFRKKLYEMIR